MKWLASIYKFLQKPTHFAVTINIQCLEFPVSAAVPASTDATSGDGYWFPYAGIPGELCRHGHFPAGQWQWQKGIGSIDSSRCDIKRVELFVYKLVNFWHITRYDLIHINKLLFQIPIILHYIHRWWRHYVIITFIPGRRITPILGNCASANIVPRRIDAFGKLPLIYRLRV